MNTQDIAKALCAHCRAGTEKEGLQTLYAENAVSIEPMAPEGASPISEGRDAIQAKHDWWNENFEVHSASLDGPFVNGDQFSIIFEIDATEKSSGNRWKANEIALYEVQDGRIVRETFFMKPME